MSRQAETDLPIYGGKAREESRVNGKDGIRQRRQQKIKQLVEQQSSRERKGWKEERKLEAKDAAKGFEPVRANRDDMYREIFPEPDPEKQWKTNPAPWLGWGVEENGTGGFPQERDDYWGSYRGTSGGGGWRSLRRELVWKAIAALCIFAAIWGMYQYDSEWTLEGRAIVKNALTEEIDFASVAAWYNQNFTGAPSFIPIFGDKAEKAQSAEGTVQLPVVSPLPEGAIVRTFAELLDGIELAGESKEQVVAAETGRVLLVTEQSDEGVTVVIEHANKRTSVYAKLGAANVKVNDWVEAGDAIGTLRESAGEEPSLLYFKVKQDDRYIDPVSVIPIG
ncbi:M23 family metallopeptidase [Paenibacillus sp. NEAU-GSW1]|uniref:M23 family metallopeptidase n=1 Tax=Paenibacillus sp. NEAU-GSW1 TaxID=2682486 RepID=UPI0012E1885E|nr:M23 family metallopeptidase [Paenibacillus sp. NEAU-GSW1]MUT64531.1 peptidoglycan DD-metalloendopeptidase family protein [Paenibacillus sp. NEAU-GSW1]